jgi:hypothetical protein
MQEIINLLEVWPGDFEARPPKIPALAFFARIRYYYPGKVAYF